ncbi:MAG: formylglycine-generating enzyme family protein, partial [Myxococcales bacterium]|nr:formylglycine-generating enzyme family protein [Myxococcales bacterium]
TTPTGAQVTVARLVERDRRLVPEGARSPLRSPVVRAPIERGAHLLTLEAPGHAPVRLPIVIERGAHWQHQPPDAIGPHALPLLPKDALGADEIYVPAGWCIVGGDALATDPMPRRRLWIDGFVIERTSVTHRTWLDFLVDVQRRFGPAAVAPLLPRRRDDAVGAGLGPVQIDADGSFALGRTDDDDAIDPETPVALIDWHAAEAFARWRAARTGQPWRLPHDLEWEKAARGVDGRRWPWGDRFEPTWARALESFAGRPHPTVVGEVPEDESPYGMRDVVGVIRNWCGSDYQREGPPGDRLIIAPASGPLRAVRGGAWCVRAALCHPAGRFANRPDQRFRTIGVRLARAISAGEVAG